MASVGSQQVLVKEKLGRVRSRHQRPESAQQIELKRNDHSSRNLRDKPRAAASELKLRIKREEMQSANAYSNNKQDFKSNQGGTAFNTLTNVQRSERRDYNASCHGCSDMRGRLLDSIKIEHNNKLKSRGGQGFLKHEL